MCGGNKNKVAPEDDITAGPLSNRHCTDIFFLILFILFWVGMFVVGGIALGTGNPYRVLYGFDSQGDVCGFNNVNGRDYTTKPFVYFGSPSSPLDTMICVTSCPTEWGVGSLSNVVCRNETLIAGWTTTYPYGCSDSLCDCFSTYPTSPVLYRCLPTLKTKAIASNYTSATILETQWNEAVTLALTSVYEARLVILYCFIAALGFSFIYIVMLRLMSGCMVWTTILLVVACVAALAALLLKWGYEGKKTYETSLAAGESTTSMRASYITYLTLGGVLALAFVIIVLIILFMRSRIVLAIAIIKEAAKAVQHMPAMFLIPLVPFLLFICFSVYWIVVAVYLGTATTATVTVKGYKTFTGENTLRALQAYHCFGGLWMAAFLVGFNDVVIAGAIASYYFRDSGKVSRFPVASSFKRAVRYHLGSIAFGSLLIAIVQFIRLMLKYFEKTLKGKDNRVFKFLLRCLDYLFKCVERFLKFITHNAYIHMALYGDNFCTSARKAFSTLMGNALRVVAINFITGFLLFIGKWAIMAGTGVLAYYLLDRLTSNSQYTYMAMPMLIILVSAYLVASCFLSVFGMAIDTLFLCFCEDQTKHELKHMSPDMKAFMEKYADVKEKKTDDKPEEKK